MPPSRDHGSLHAGPILFARDGSEAESRLTALIVLAERDLPPALWPDDSPPVTPQCLYRQAGLAVWRYDFALPARADAGYEVAGRRYAVAAALDGALRVAFVACNGKENGDRERDLAERNALWRRLREVHDGSPLHLLLHGGDQIYADEVLDAHPDLQRWRSASPTGKAAMPWQQEHAEAAEGYFFQRYLELLTHPDPAYLMARVPSVMMWDDHDIFDGWGSHPRPIHDSPVAQGLFATARRFFRLFQSGAAPDDEPDADDPEPLPLGQGLSFPGLGIVAPDLRSQRLPDRVMAPSGWRRLEEDLQALADRPRLLILSSVPALGPRLSLLETVLDYLPGSQKYEDDLRDQWQSRAHRTEWRRFLETLLRPIEHNGQQVTVLSGEIHLATRGEIHGQKGTLHQLVASGIAHPPPPRAWARTLGLLARLGETPVPEHPVRMRPLPGQRKVYTADRNFLLLERTPSAWTACWWLEKSGWTNPLAI